MRIKYSYYITLYLSDIANIPYLIFLRHTALSFIHELIKDIKNILSLDATLRDCLIFILRVVISPILFLFMPILTYINLNRIKKQDNEGFFWEHKHLYMVNDKYIKASKKLEWN